VVGIKSRKIGKKIWGRSKGGDAMLKKRKGFIKATRYRSEKNIVGFFGLQVRGCNRTGWGSFRKARAV